jgi:hypothetical protein
MNTAGNCPWEAIDKKLGHASSGRSDSGLKNPAGYDY